MSISLGVEILYDFPRNTTQKTSLLQKRKPKKNSNKKDQKANIQSVFNLNINGDVKSGHVKFIEIYTDSDISILKCY